MQKHKTYFSSNKSNFIFEKIMELIKLTKEEEELFECLEKIASESNTIIRVVGGWVRDKVKYFWISEIQILI